MGFHHHYVWGPRLVPRLMGGASAATVLLGAETDGLSIDFTDASLVVRDTTTTSNAYNGDVQAFWRDRSFTSYASPSPKITRGSDGLYGYRPHNLLKMSEAFGSGAWTKNNLSVSSDSIAAPDGTTTADTITSTSTTDAYVYQGATTVNSGQYTTSFYIKKGTAAYCYLNAFDGSNHVTWINLTDGTVGTNAAGNTASVTALSNSWYRVSIARVTADTTTNATIALSDADNSAAVTNGVTAYIWGAQLNAGPTATTYVKTAAHNLCTQSQTFDNAAWIKTAVTVSADAVAAPDGTTTADKLVETVANSAHQANKSTTAVSPSLTYTASCYFKAAERDCAHVQVNTEGGGTKATAAYFDLTNVTSSTEVLIAGVTTVSTSITAVGNGWFRCVYTFTVAAAITSVDVYVGPLLDATTRSYAGDNTKGIYAWGAQLELASSPGKYVTTTASAVYETRYELPREWDANGVCQGLLVEEARTNLCLRSETIAHAAWGGKSFVTDNFATAPDGRTTAARILNAGGGDNVAQTVGVSAGTAYVFSFFAKNNGGSAARYRVYDLTNGADIVAAASFFSSINGSTWTRITVSFTAPVGCTEAIVYVYADIANADYLVWGAQLEAGAFATSYIPTTSASVTRAADTIELVATTSVFPKGTTAETLYAAAASLQSSIATFVAMYTSGGGNRLQIRRNGSDFEKVDDLARPVTAIAYASPGKGAVAYSGAGASLAFNGSSNTAAGAPASITPLLLGIGKYNSEYANGYIKQVMYLPRRMTDGQLQTVTT